MRVLVDIGHPAYVHLFKNLMWNLERDGHEVKITARKKDVTQNLLEIYGFEFENLGKPYKGLLKKGVGIINFNKKLFRICKKFKPDVLVGASGNLYVAQVGKIIGKPSIIFDDTEHAIFEHKLTFPFATVICTPACYKKDLGPKQVRYNGYHELAYLHPNYFKPQTSVLDELGLDKKDKFIILRFVSWAAAHDVGQKGLDIKKAQKFVDKLSKHAQLFITSERKLSSYLEKYRLTVSPHKIHDIIYFADICIGDGATMATEAAVLGTASIYNSSLVGKMGNFEELERRYGLIYSFRNTSQALDKALELLEDKDLKPKWQKKREKLLEGKIDVTKFMTEFIERFPESFEEYKREYG